MRAASIAIAKADAASSEPTTARRRRLASGRVTVPSLLGGYAAPVRVTVCDVGPRDGLQNEPDVLAPAMRAELVNRLAAAGLPRVEAVSFVREDRVPQMAGAEEVVAAPDRPAGGAGLR